MYKRGAKIVQETRRWLPETGITKLMRTKETEADYGYIFEPDLTEITIKETEKNETKKQIPGQKWNIPQDLIHMGSAAQSR